MPPSHVDESLFGKPSRKTQRAALPTNSVVVSASELSKIRSRAVVRSVAEEAAEREERMAEFERKKVEARKRKEKMQKMAEASKLSAKKSDVEMAKLTREKTIRDMADKLVDENLDLVKMLNTLGSRAAAFTIRDSQLAEKEGRGGEEADYNRKMELEMEIDRLKDLAERERVEDEKRSKRIADREVIVGQIEYRQKLKMLAEEQRERDNQQMLDQMKKYDEADARKAAKHKVVVEKAKVEIMRANEESLERKKTVRAAEIAEVEALRVYQAKRDAEMARREALEEEIAEEKREQQKKLLAAQEKVQSGQSEVDELRARRYAEERERKARNEERIKAQKKRASIVELMESRKAQAEAKKSMMAREAVMQQQEYEDGIKYSIAITKREKAEAAAKHEKSEEHRIKLQAQIDTREIARKKQQSVKFEEGRKLKEEFAVERAKLETIRDCMVEDMIKKGINPKYLSEMRQCDIEKMQMR